MCDYITCPTCGQQVSVVPLEEQCDYPGCHDWSEYEAWFRNGILNQRLRVCEKHVKLSIGYEKNGEDTLEKAKNE